MTLPEQAPDSPLVYVSFRLEAAVAERVDAIAEASRRATGKTTNRSDVIRLGLGYGLDQAEQELTSS